MLSHVSPGGENWISSELLMLGEWRKGGKRNEGEMSKKEGGEAEGRIWPALVLAVLVDSWGPGGFI